MKMVRQIIYGSATYHMCSHVSLHPPTMCLHPGAMFPQDVNEDYPYCLKIFRALWEDAERIWAKKGRPKSKMGGAKGGKASTAGAKGAGASTAREGEVEDAKPTSWMALKDNFCARVMNPNIRAQVEGNQFGVITKLATLPDEEWRMLELLMDAADYRTGKSLPGVIVSVLCVANEGVLIHGVISPQLPIASSVSVTLPTGLLVFFLLFVVLQILQYYIHKWAHWGVQ